MVYLKIYSEAHCGAFAGFVYIVIGSGADLPRKVGVLLTSTLIYLIISV